MVGSQKKETLTFTGKAVKGQIKTIFFYIFIVSFFSSLPNYANKWYKIIHSDNMAGFYRYNLPNNPFGKTLFSIDFSESN